MHTYAGFHIADLAALGMTTAPTPRSCGAWSAASPAAARHAERLQAFYAPQASHYDAFRERLLHGRAELMDAAATRRPARGSVELGAGTGRNLDFLGERLRDLAYVELVDLCPALLRAGPARAPGDLPNVRVIEADAVDLPARASRSTWSTSPTRSP